jgi:hypothetical protein
MIMNRSYHRASDPKGDMILWRRINMDYTSKLVGAHGSQEISPSKLPTKAQ